MKKQDIARASSEFGAMLGKFADGFLLDEREADGGIVIVTPADSVSLVRSSWKTIRNGGVPEKRVVHWINIRLGSIDEERTHVRKIVDLTQDERSLVLTTDAGRRITLSTVGENYPDRAIVEQLAEWRRLRDTNRNAYEAVGRNLMSEAEHLAKNWR